VPVRTEVLMGTIVTIQIVPDGHRASVSAVAPHADADAAVDRAFGWFREIETRCTKFDADSELMQACARVGVPTRVSPIVFEAVRFALAVADDTGGAFDPTVAAIAFRVDAGRTGRVADYRDVLVDPDAQTITLRRPLTIDLGAVAKGLAVDAAARELQPFRDFAIDAGGDLYLGGRNPEGTRWSVGIRHPREDKRLLDTLFVSDTAVCTSGDYERPGHIVNPRSGASADTIASVTVVAAGAMLADALGTAAFVLGPAEGLRLFERHGVEGLIVTTSLERFETARMPRS
jgi:FAD:protein FMN transferase